MTIIDNQKRSILSEGRNYGLGFAFLNRLDENTFETVQPISPCKDYLNDVVYSEATGKPFAAWGLKTKKQGIFDGEHAYMVISICKLGRSLSSYLGYDEEMELMANNGENMAEFMHKIEAKLGIGKTKFHQLADNLKLLEMDKQWVAGTYLISLYSLMLRVALSYKGGGVMTHIKEIDSPDRMMLNGIKEKLLILFERKGNLPKQNMTNLEDVHNHGIVGANFNNSKLYELSPINA
jgi:hypothetical protein